MSSLGPRIWLPNAENFFRELVDLIRNAEQSHTHCDSPDFYCRRLAEYERTLSVLTTRITESYPTEQFLINNLHILCTYLNSLRNEFDVIVENYERTSERFSLEESTIVRFVQRKETGSLVGQEYKSQKSS
jgi:hypothetical protein